MIIIMMDNMKTMIFKQHLRYGTHQCMQLSSSLICEIIIVMCFNIVDLNYFPLQIIFVKFAFYIYHFHSGLL